jgi:hypothetical protein
VIESFRIGKKNGKTGVVQLYNGICTVVHKELYICMIECKNGIKCSKFLQVCVQIVSSYGGRIVRGIVRRFLMKKGITRAYKQMYNLYNLYMTFLSFVRAHMRVRDHVQYSSLQPFNNEFFPILSTYVFTISPIEFIMQILTNLCCFPHVIELYYLGGVAIPATQSIPERIHGHGKSSYFARGPP